MSRREELEQMLKDEPGDTFLRYALAMELDSVGDSAASLSIYSELMKENPPHLPSFFRTAQIHVRNGKARLAQDALTAGIQLANSTGDAHTAAEMNDLLCTIEDLDDDDEL